MKFPLHTFIGTYVIPLSELYLVDRLSCTCTNSTIINSLCTNCLTSGPSERPLSYLRSLSRSGLANFNAQESNIVCKDLSEDLTCVQISNWEIELSKTPFLQTMFFFFLLDIKHKRCIFCANNVAVLCSVDLLYYVF